MNRHESERLAIAEQEARGSYDPVPRYRFESVRAVLAQRERELLELKGPCNNGCRLHHAHSGPCDIQDEADL